MSWFDHPLLSALSIWDALAAIVLLSAWLGLSWWIDSGPQSARSMSHIMDERRADWMRRMAGREHRIFDASLLASLQSGSSLFASASLLAVGGVLALLAEPDRLARIATELPLAPDGLPTDTPLLWEAKLLLLLALVVTAFLKFAWCARLFNYCALLMGATAPPGQGGEGVAAQAAAVNRQAGRSFNRGLRALYFGLAALAWLAGPAACVLATAAVAWVIYRREFLSISRDAVAGEL